MEYLKRIPRVDRVIFVTMVSAGLLVPWAVAAGVKLHLESIGAPTWPWSTFAAFAIPGVFLSVIAAAPLIGLAALHHWWALGRFLPWGPLRRRLVVLFGFAGCVVGMVRVFVDVFWVFDPTELLELPVIVARYLPHMAAGLVAGALVAVVVGLLVRDAPAAAPRQTDEARAGGAGAAASIAGPSPARAPQPPGRGALDRGLAREAAARARSIRNAAVAEVVAIGFLAAATAGSPEGSIEGPGALELLLAALAVGCSLWSSWTIARGAWLLGGGWKLGFFLSWMTGPTVLVFALAVFLRLRRMGSEAGGRRPAGHAGPPRAAEA